MQGIYLLDVKAFIARKAVFGECFTPESKDLDNRAGGG
jgi:hypothetical protein